MKAETVKEIYREKQLVNVFEKTDIVLRNKNLVVESEEDENIDNEKSEGKNKRKEQLYKQTKKDLLNPQEEKENVNIDLIKLLFKEKCVLTDDVSDVIARSPMRTQTYHHGCEKPYECSKSKNSRGVTRVVELDETSSAVAGHCHLYPNFNPSMGIFSSFFPEGARNGDVDIGDVNQWLNLCKTDPKFLNDFVEDCKTELSKKDIPNFQDYRFSRSTCSNVSSQLTSPSQSPSEYSLTSPESVTCEENSLYGCKSPNIPFFYNFNISPVEEEPLKTISLNTGATVVNNFNEEPTAENGSEVSETEKAQKALSSESFPNIGTVMLNLAEDPYESTVDLNQFATVCDTHNDPDFQMVPPTFERDLLNQKLNSKAKENAWARINQLNIDLLGEGDKEGDTQLMILLVSEKVTLEYVYVIVERLLKEDPRYLSLRNELNQDALYLASLKIIWEPLVASYIAEAYVRGKQDVNMKYEGGNTLLHCLAKKGDIHSKVLERLVRLRHANNSPVFDINKKNKKGFTPLHLACELHRKEMLHSYRTVRVLIENGADCFTKDYKDENTPLHTLINESCDIELIRILLETMSKCEKTDSPPLTTIPNRQGNTALHLACGKNSLSLVQQKDLIGLLLRHGALIHLKNINGYVPSVLVDNNRKQEIKSFFHSCKHKSL